MCGGLRRPAFMDGGFMLGGFMLGGFINGGPTCAADGPVPAPAPAAIGPRGSPQGQDHAGSAGGGLSGHERSGRQLTALEYQWPLVASAPSISELSKVQSVDQRMRLWNAVSAFANCGRAVAHVRGSYGPRTGHSHLPPQMARLINQARRPQHKADIRHSSHEDFFRRRVRSAQC